MPSISLCMIVKNEEETIERVLESIKDAMDEIIIVDTGSTDNTKEIAKKYTQKIYDYEWTDNFSDARNYSFEMATSDYIMWLDADDIVPKDTLHRIMKLKQNMSADTYMLKYSISNDPNNTFVYYRERILRNCTEAKWHGVVHECITPFGKIEWLDIKIEHKKIKTGDKNRNLKIYRKILKQRVLEPREQYYYSRELYDHGYYKSSIKAFKKFIRDGKGWIENVIDSYYMIGLSYIALNDTYNAKHYLTASLLQCSPRSNIACAIADCYYMENNYNMAIEWYILALHCNKLPNSGAFVQNIYSNYYPYLQLCLCYYRLKDLTKAVIYNEKAGEYNNSTVVQNNRQFFNSLLQKND